MKSLIALIIVSINCTLNGMAGTEDWDAHVQEQKIERRKRLDLQRQLLYIEKYHIWRVVLTARMAANEILSKIELKKEITPQSTKAIISSRMFLSQHQCCQNSNADFLS